MKNCFLIVLALCGTTFSFSGQTKTDSTEATFDFECTMKLNYAGSEDEIIQSIEKGNVSLSLLRNAEGRFVEKTGSEKAHNTFNFDEKIQLNVISIIGDKLTLAKRPVSQKVNFSDEPIASYTIGPEFHFDSLLIDSLLKTFTPIDTKEKSTVTFGNLEINSLLGQQKSKEPPFTDSVSEDEILQKIEPDITKRPITQKVNVSDEPLDNRIYGIDKKSDSSFIEIPLADPFLFIGSSISEDILSEKMYACLQFLIPFFLD